MFPDVRPLIAAMIVSVVALSCGFGVFAAFRVNHEPLARLPSAAPPLQLLASISASPPITIAAVEPFDRGLRASDSRGAVELADAPARMSAASDHAASTSAAEPEASPVAANNPSAAPLPQAQDSEAEHQTSPPAADVAAAVSAPASAAVVPGVAVVEAPADQSIMIDEAGQETEFVSTGVPEAPAKAAAKAARKKKIARPHAASKTHHARKARPDGVDGFASSNTQETSSAVGGPFVSPLGW